MDIGSRARSTRRGLDAAAASVRSQPKTRTWRVLRARAGSSRKDLRLALTTWIVVFLVGIGGIATLSRWGITVGVIALLVAGRQLARVVGWLRQSPPS